jgi:hypothetical protein
MRHPGYRRVQSGLSDQFLLYTALTEIIKPVRNVQSWIGSQFKSVIPTEYLGHST